jgi:hypothetical protein
MERKFAHTIHDILETIERIQWKPAADRSLRELRLGESYRI